MLRRKIISKQSLLWGRWRAEGRDNKQWEGKHVASGGFQISKPLDLDTDPLKIIQFRV